MKTMKKRTLLTLCASGLMLAGSAQAGIVFNDNFNIGSSIDLDEDIAIRQAAGTVTSTYTATTSLASNDISANDLRKKAGEVYADTNFASHIGANDFTLSIDGRMATAAVDWQAFSLLSANETNRGSSPLSFYMRGTDRIVVTGVGTITKATIQATGGANASWDVQSFANYAFVATATDANSGTFDFQINGQTIASSVGYAFTESTLRRISWQGQNATGVGRWDNVTLDVVPEPGTLGLLMASGAGILFIRRKFMV